MLKSGIIHNDEIIKLNSEEIINYLKNLLTDETLTEFKVYQNKQIFISEDASMTNITYIEYFVQFKNYVVIYNHHVYYNPEATNIDKISYINNNYTLKKLPKMIFENGKPKKYISEENAYLNKVGLEHSFNSENNLEYWFPKTENIGFKTPKTIIIPFVQKEIDLIKSYKWNELNKRAIIERIKYHSEGLNLKKDMFIRLSGFSNKFNFESCHIKNLEELPDKLMINFDNLIFRLEWEKQISLILREYIKTNYERKTIYNGMPLNTEFRVFYDFDNHDILGIYNYWDTDTMLDNLYDKKDLLNFAYEAKNIENDFNKLEPLLEKQIIQKMHNVNLNGKWSIDFLYNGKEFVLIDMAHAECSHYYDKVLQKRKLR